MRLEHPSFDSRAFKTDQPVTRSIGIVDGQELFTHLPIAIILVLQTNLEYSSSDFKPFNTSASKNSIHMDQLVVQSNSPIMKNMTHSDTVTALELAAASIPASFFDILAYLN